MRIFALSASVLLVVASVACAAEPPGPGAAPDSTATSTPEPTASAAGQANPTPTAPAPSLDADIAADIASFTLPDLTVTVGTAVTWTNRDSAPHTATSGTASAPSGVWDSGNLQQGQSYSFTFGETGEFAYFCIVHPSMTATLHVVEATDGEAAGSPVATPHPDAGSDMYEDYDY